MVHVVINANRSQEKGKISSLGSQRKKDITAVLEETGKEIMNQASSTQNRVNAMATGLTDEANSIRDGMRRAEDRMETFEAKLQHQSSLLSRKIPALMRMGEDKSRRALALTVTF